ncbi:MAG: flavodoxin-dependent (E)-4-hydroxy-3-methylbut-2-enyl-diphosphate synthase, partial [bacterium]
MGIGAVLVDGLGDTIRVSLTEAPEFEIPVARKLINLTRQESVLALPSVSEELPYNPVSFERRPSDACATVGGGQVPVVIADFSRNEAISPANLYAAGYV